MTSTLPTPVSAPVVHPRPDTQRPEHAPRPTTDGRERADPCTMVIFGATGDLTRRKLMPAVYSLMKEGLVHPDFAVLGVGRDTGISDAQYRKMMLDALEESDEIDGVDRELW